MGHIFMRVQVFGLEAARLLGFRETRMDAYNRTVTGDEADSSACSGIGQLLGTICGKASVA